MNPRAGIVPISIMTLTAACGGGERAALRDAAALAAQFEAVGAALDGAPLQALGALALPMYLAGVEVHSISPFDLGKTLEWDAATARYVRSSRTDGPPDGLRVSLYAVSPETGLPALPLKEVGALDLFAQNSLLGSHSDSVVLRFVVRGAAPSSVTLADFTARGVFQPGCLCASVAGYVTDGRVRVDFSIPYEIVLQGPVYFGGFRHPAATFDAAPPNLHVLNNTVINEDRGEAFDFAYEITTDARLEFHEDSLAASGKLTVFDSGASSTDVRVAANGREIGTMTASNGAETFTGAGNTTLGPDDQRVLRALATALFAIGLNLEYPVLVIFYCGC